MKSNLHCHKTDGIYGCDGHPDGALQSTESRLCVCSFNTAHLSVKKSTVTIHAIVSINMMYSVCRFNDVRCNFFGHS